MAETKNDDSAEAAGGEDIYGADGDSGSARDIGDTGDAAGDAVGVPDARGTEGGEPEDAPGGPSAGNTLGDTVGPGPEGGPSDMRIPSEKGGDTGASAGG